MRGLKLTKRRIIILISAWALVIAGSLGLTAFQVRQGNLRELRSAFARWVEPHPHRTVVVFAPHCDDETLGAGGLLRQSVGSGADVHVVLMTNGDGFRYAATVDSRSLRINPGYYVEFGYRRQRESFAALEKLGVSVDRVTTLGYPDRGLESMWLSNWNSPYVSPYTRDCASPYANSYTAGASYTGRQVLADLMRLLRDIDPDDIYIPHPNDQHSDHWATSAFVTEALYELGWLDKKNVALYLVHRGDWPVPQGLHEKAHLAPPAKLTNLDTRWRQFSLDGGSVEAKRLAIEEFRSQTAVTRRFLRSFVRQNELFGTRSPFGRMWDVEAVRVDGRPDDWSDVPPLIYDPADDGLVTHSRPAADLTGVWVGRDRERLILRISARGVINRATTYELRVRLLGSGDETVRVVLKRGRRVPEGWTAAFGRRDIELACPLDRFRGRPMMVAAGARVGWFRVDRTAFCILRP